MLRLQLVALRMLGALSALARGVRGFGKDERGASMVEYALMVVAIIAVVGAGVGVLSGAFTNMFTDLAVELSTAADDVASAAT